MLQSDRLTWGSQDQQQVQTRQQRPGPTTERQTVWVEWYSVRGPMAEWMKSFNKGKLVFHAQTRPDTKNDVGEIMWLYISTAGGGTHSQGGAQLYGGGSGGGGRQVSGDGDRIWRHSQSLQHRRSIRIAAVLPVKTQNLSPTHTLHIQNQSAQTSCPVPVPVSPGPCPWRGFTSQTPNY